MSKPIPIILDGDPGHDDAIAWMLAASSPKLKILAVTSPYYSTLLDEIRIYIDLTYIVDDDRKAYTVSITQNSIEQRSLAASQISGDQQHRHLSIFSFHDYKYSTFPPNIEDKLGITCCEMA